MLKEKLKKALKEKGLKEGLADVINITSEDQIEGIVNQLTSTQSQEEELDFTEVLGSQNFKDFVQKHGFDKVLELSKTLQSAHDKKVASGIKSFRDKYLKQIDEEGDGNEPPEGDDTPEWAKALIEKVDKMEKKSQNVTKTEQVQELLKKSKLPEKLQQKWLSRVDLNSETSFENQITALEEEHQELHKDIIGESAGQGLPISSISSEKISDDELANVLEKI